MPSDTKPGTEIDTKPKRKPQISSSKRKPSVKTIATRNAIVEIAKTVKPGRPTVYHPALCDKLIEAGSKGFSLTAFAGMILVSRDTLHQWATTYPEFSDAIRKHRSARTYALEKTFLNTKHAAVVTSRTLALKNAAPDEWRDKQHHEVTATITLADFVNESLKDIT